MFVAGLVGGGMGGRYTKKSTKNLMRIYLLLCIKCIKSNEQHGTCPANGNGNGIVSSHKIIRISECGKLEETGGNWGETVKSS